MQSQGVPLGHIRQRNVTPKGDTVLITETRRVYKPEEVGDLLGISRSSVYRLMGEGVLKSIKVGGSRRITAEQLDDYIARQTEAAA